MLLQPRGLNQPENVTPVVQRPLRAATATGRGVGALVLLMVIADATDALAMAKWEHDKAGTDLEALAWQRTQASADTKASKDSTFGQMIERQKADPIPTGMLKLIGSYANVAPEECVADRHESPHFANLYDMALKYADVLPVAEVREALRRAIAARAIDPA